VPNPELCIATDQTSNDDTTADALSLGLHRDDNTKLGVGVLRG